MVTVCISEGRITARGHAGAGPKGHDLVCAGVSVLLAALAEYLEQTGAKELSVLLEPGRGDIAAAGAAAAFAQTAVGLELLAGAYPACISVSKEHFMRKCRSGLTEQKG